MSAVTWLSSSNSAAVAARKRAAVSASNTSRGRRPYVMSAATMKGHHAPSDCGDAAAALPPSSLKNCDCSISAALGTAPGASAAQGHAIACTTRVTSPGSASSVVLQPKARSENVTSMTAATSAATLNATAAVCAQFRSCHFANRRYAARAAWRSNNRATSGDACASLAEDPGRPRTRIQRRDEILDATQVPAHGPATARASAPAARAARRPRARVTVRR